MGVFPRAANARSIAAKRRSNLRLVSTQNAFRVGIEMAGKIDNREQQIADFGRHPAFVAAIEFGFDLVCFLADLGEDSARIVPVEADASGLVLQLQGTG